MIDENVVVGAYDRILHYSLKYVLYIGEKIKVEERVDGMGWMGLDVATSDALPFIPLVTIY